MKKIPLSSEFQSHSNKLRISSNTLIILITLFVTKWETKNVPIIVSSEFQSHSIKIEDICRDGVSDGVSEGKLDP